MTLKEYLEREKISQRLFARTLGISNRTIANISSKGKRPSAKIAKMIEAKTYGKVKASELLLQEPWIRVERYR